MSTVTFNLCASLFLADHEGHVLLVKHAKHGLWLAPGGKIEPGERPLNTALREMLEETGIAATRFGLIDLMPRYIEDSDFGVFLFKARLLGEERPVPVSDGSWTEHAWVDSYSPKTWPRGLRPHVRSVLRSLGG